MIYIRINNTLYPANITGSIGDLTWGRRDTKTIRLEMTYQEAIQIFQDGVSWSTVETNSNENDLIIREEDESEYSLVGDITSHQDGTISVVMGKITDRELLEIIMGGNL